MTDNLDRIMRDIEFALENWHPAPTNIFAEVDARWAEFDKRWGNTVYDREYCSV